MDLSSTKIFDTNFYTGLLDRKEILGSVCSLSTDTHRETFSGHGTLWRKDVSYSEVSVTDILLIML